MTQHINLYWYICYYDKSHEDSLQKIIKRYKNNENKKNTMRNTYAAFYDIKS